MPNPIDEYEVRDPDGEPTNAERVLRFLARHSDEAYKAAEIANETGINQNSFHPVLHRLEERELVRHREPYWAIGEPAALRDAQVFGSTASFLNDVLGPEGRSDWIEAASAIDE